MGYYLTPEQLAYGKQHEQILTNRSGYPMTKSKISLINLIKHSGWGNNNWANSWNGLVGAYYSWNNSTQTPTYMFYTFKHFVITRIRWRWTRSGTGWGSYPVSHVLYNKNVGKTIYRANQGLNTTYDIRISDNDLLALDLSDANTYLRCNMQAKGSNGVQGALEIRGFQTPYPNLAGIKLKENNIYPLQVIGYKDNDGIVHSAGRLL